MQLEKSKRDKLLKIMNKAENQDFIKNLAICLIALCPLYTKDEFNCCIMLIKIVPFIVVIISLIGPYLMLIFALSYHYTVDILLLSIICSIFFTISLLGIFGKGMVCCLIYPCNWFFLMLCSDLITIACDIFIFIIHIHHHSLDNNDYFGIIAIVGNIVFCTIFLVQHSRVYSKINIIFEAIRTLEMEIIYYATHKYLECEV